MTTNAEDIILRILFASLLVWTACPLPPVFGKAPNLLVTADLDCRLKIDGKEKGTVKAGAPLGVDIPRGTHRIEALSLAGDLGWRDTVNVTGSDGQQFAIPLRAKGYWTDRNTGLVWTVRDNGSGVTYPRADYYCRTLTLGGYNDWTLPAIEDLSKLFGGTANAGGFHTTSPLQFSGWEWSASAGRETGEQWALDFGDGGRSSVVTGDSGLNRALCVRRAKQ